MEKLLEDALLKVSSVASTLDTLSARDMIEALIAGERDPRVLAGWRGRMRGKYAELIEPPTGQFDDHHAELARMLLDQIYPFTGRSELNTRIEEDRGDPRRSSVDAGDRRSDNGRWRWW